MGSANVFAVIALAAYAPVTYGLIKTLGPTRGVLAALLGGWLLLPVFDDQVAVPLLRSKGVFVPGVVLLTSLAIDWDRWTRLRWHWVDLVAALVAVGPFVTALANGLGPYEGGSAMFDALMGWCAPYALGRCYLGRPQAAREYARWLVGAGLLYVPLCLWEVRMSPQLHRLVYGYRAAGSFGMAVRYGGFRPDVFMAHGLAVGMFMAAAALTAYWLWRSRAAPQVLGVPLGWSFLLLAATTVLVKSTGAVILLAVGLATLEAARLLRSSAPLLILALAPLVFCTARISGWTAGEVVEAASRIDPERADSIQFRIRNEQELLDKADQRPLLGWGRWGRSRITDADGRDVSTTDSLWIIALGTGGLVGLASIGLLLLAPSLLLLRRMPARHWGHPALGPAATLALVTILWVLDSLLNNMRAPFYPAMAGATISFLAHRPGGRRRPRPHAPTSTDPHPQGGRPPAPPDRPAQARLAPRRSTAASPRP